jgi:hypothetical protein
VAKQGLEGTLESFLRDCKKKDHTIKAQLSIDLNTHKILATAFAPGRVHDLTLFKDHLHEVSIMLPCLFDIAG